MVWNFGTFREFLFSLTQIQQVLGSFFQRNTVGLELSSGRFQEMYTTSNMRIQAAMISYLVLVGVEIWDDQWLFLVPLKGGR